MKNVALALLLVTGTCLAAEPQPLAWATHANRSADSIPAGNGDIGINVWTEENGDLLLYVGKTDAFDESCRLLKLGRLRVHFSGNPFAKGQAFRQELNLRDGMIDIQTPQSKISIWVDANQPVIHLETDAAAPIEQTVQLEIWRTEKRPLQQQWEKHAVDGMSATEPPLQYPDTLANVTNQIVWYHRNEVSIQPVSLKLQGLDPAKSAPDPLLGRTFGAAVAGDGFVSVNSTTLKTATPVIRTHLIICPLTQQTSAADWLKEISKQTTRLRKLSLEPDRAHCCWWNEFWSRSWVRVSGGNTNETVAITLGWTLNRYITACTARGNAPVKFNGAIFNVDGIDVDGNPAPGLNADARAWGPGFWNQNERHIYWPMLQAGDYEQLLPFFKMYRDALPLAMHRTQTYYHHGGEFFPETMYLWGTYLNSGDCGYGWDRTGKELGLTDNGYIRRHWQGGIEVTAMMLEYYRHTGDQRFARETLLPIAGQIVTFYDEHYKRDAKGKIRFEPAQVLESMWDVVNPMPEIAGLHCCLTGLLELPVNLTTAAQRQQWQRVLGELPALPMAKFSDATVLWNAEIVRGNVHNIENGSLYAVWPYQQLGVGIGNLKFAQDSYFHRWHQGGPYESWVNDTIFAAYCGLAKEATDHLAFRFLHSNGLRFPAFYAPGSWVPDLENGCVCQNTIQSMLMQTVGKKIYLLPAWPADWDCDFKLHAPFETVVTGKIQHGKPMQFDVQPAGRRNDVIVLQAQGNK